MKSLSILIVVILLSTGCHCEIWSSITSLAIDLIDLHNWSSGQPYDVLGHECSNSTKGRFIRLKWVWDGQFRCPNWTYIIGESRHSSSRTIAIERAIQDFVKRAQIENIISADQAISFGK